MLKAYIIAVLTTAVFLNLTYAQACNVPVFRYALERWPSDPYEAVVFHNGPMTAEQADVFFRLVQSVETSPDSVNLVVKALDIADGDTGTYSKLWESLEHHGLPCIALRYPAVVGYEGSVWSAPLSIETVKTILNSPVRKKIADALLDGESAVWVFMESGDKARDNKAVNMLETQLADLEKTLELPVALDGIYGAEVVDVSDGPEVSISFSLIRLSRDDPAEAAFAAMLFRSEPDLSEYEGQPMAFPVYGRGRALYALIGEGITSRNIRAACVFLTGACSCEVKAMNPGIDLLMAVDWESAIHGSWIEDVALPPLVGLSELVPVNDSDALTLEKGDPAGNTGGVDTPEGNVSEDGFSGTDSEIAAMGYPLVRNIVYALTAILSVIVILSLTIARRKT